ncbi:hypothetical protein B0H21DRAFT_732632 [Amylocystis lapponica]|nr:hypothetical protein B0H21DRAFT_732632 [Amylocystis lapponica]
MLVWPQTGISLVLSRTQAGILRLAWPWYARITTLTAHTILQVYGVYCCVITARSCDGAADDTTCFFVIETFETAFRCVRDISDDIELEPCVGDSAVRSMCPAYVFFHPVFRSSKFHTR